MPADVNGRSGMASLQGRMVLPTLSGNFDVGE